MTQANNQSSHLSLTSRMLIGAGIGLVVISYFLISLTAADPAWGKFWMVQPLLVAPFAGAMGGLCNYYIVHFRWVFGVNKMLAIIASVIVFLVGMWMGIVLGLHGTMWN
jgi:hypothetical protein